MRPKSFSCRTSSSEERFSFAPPCSHRPAPDSSSSSSRRETLHAVFVFVSVQSSILSRVLLLSARSRSIGMRQPIHRYVAEVSSFIVDRSGQSTVGKIHRMDPHRWRICSPNSSAVAPAVEKVLAVLVTQLLLAGDISLVNVGGRDLLV